MKGTSTKSVFLTALALAASLAVASAAWACTQQSLITHIGPRYGPAGAEATISGESPVPGAQVQLRWNAPDGIELGRATTGSTGAFSIPVSIPNAPAGVYYILMVTGDGAVARAPFQVSSAATTGSGPGTAPTALTEGLWSGFAGDSASASSIGDQPTGAGNSNDLGRNAGLGLLAVGAVALAAGIAGITATRRTKSASHR